VLILGCGLGRLVWEVAKLGTANTHRHYLKDRQTYPYVSQRERESTFICAKERIGHGSLFGASFISEVLMLAKCGVIEY